ncbi:MAG: DUF2089 family protein, partial [Myxococcota bacterium]
SCHGPLQVTCLSCTVCPTHVEGCFQLPALLRLSHEDIDFVMQFVKNSGSLKKMAVLLGQSYPTIRQRLNEIIQ